jgi:hypothetical protein
MQGQEKRRIGDKKIKEMNISLLCKWWWLLENEDGMWQDIVRLKYVNGTPVCLIQPRMCHSPCWKDLMKIRRIYLAGKVYENNDGKMISFWLDHWMSDEPICKKFPILFELTVNQKCSVHEVAAADWVIQFKIRLPPIIRDQWYRLATMLNEVNLNDARDNVRWKWTPNKQFSVKLVYLHLTRDENRVAYREIWKAKIPLKIKIFMWMVAQRAILTKDNLIARNWQGDPNCYLCGSIESVDHLLFQCPISRVVWGVLAICFNQRARPSSYE